MSNHQKPFFSSTAEMTCLLRAKSFGETRARYKGDDFIAVLLAQARTSFSSMIQKSFLLGPDASFPTVPPGTYEYILARTNYLDGLINTLPAGIVQVFILGAGYDSRACRFQQTLKNYTVYECDHPDMQARKKELFRKIDIDFPINVHFIPIDFARQNLCQRLVELNIAKGQICFFIIEGLLCYLTQQQVDTLFTAISIHGGAQSRVAFDYMYRQILDNETRDAGAASYAEAVKGLGEAWLSGITKGTVSRYLAKFGFSIIEETTARDLTGHLFTDDRQRAAARIMELFSLVYAQKNADEDV